MGYGKLFRKNLRNFMSGGPKRGSTVYKGPTISPEPNFNRNPPKTSNKNKTTFDIRNFNVNPKKSKPTFTDISQFFGGSGFTSPFAMKSSIKKLLKK